MHSFDRVTPLLAATCRVIRVDLLGHGGSGRSTGGYDSDHQAAMVDALLDQLGVVPGVVVGHSFGADVAIALAEQRRQVTGLVVIGQAPDYSSARIPRGGWLMGNLLTARLIRRFAPAPAVRRVARFAFAQGARPETLFDHPGRIVEDFRLTAPEVYRTVLVDRPRQLDRRGLDQRLRDLGLPTLAILGAQDQLYPPLPTRARYAAVPNVRVEMLAASGHSPVLEQPDEVAGLILRFVAETEPASLP
jgi:pimeloyl-ACP methyl ester carboxylesterase